MLEIMFRVREQGEASGSCQRSAGDGGDGDRFDRAGQKRSRFDSRCGTQHIVGPCGNMETCCQEILWFHHGHEVFSSGGLSSKEESSNSTVALSGLLPHIHRWEMFIMHVCLSTVVHVVSSDSSLLSPAPAAPCPASSFAAARSTAMMLRSSRCGKPAYCMSSVCLQEREGPKEGCVPKVGFPVRPKICCLAQRRSQK